jgi:outer membrane biosynthesis protein TonB
MKTELRYMCIDGTKLKYAKKESDLNGTKGVKSIELKAANIISEKDEEKGKWWIRIKGKENREIACKTSESRDKWLEILKGIAEAKKDEPKKTEKTKEEPKKVDKPKEEPKKTDKPKEEPKKNR